MLRFGLSFLCIGGAPRPRQKSAKVFEIKELSLDFGCGYGTKAESPACAGLWFLPDLIVAAVSRLVRPGAEALFGGWLFRGAEGPRLIPNANANAKTNANTGVLRCAQNDNGLGSW